MSDLGDLLGCTPEQDAALEKVQKARANGAILFFVGNLLSTIFTSLTVITPIVLCLITGDWINIFLMILYPIVLFPASILNHSGSSMGFKFLIPLIVFNIFLSLINAPSWYWVIGIGLLASYMILFNAVPRANMKTERLEQDPNFLKVQELIDTIDKAADKTIKNDN